ICNISGFVGKPESAKKKGFQQFFFVNGRYMKHPYFHKAVMTAYDRLLPEGLQVSYFIYLTVDPQDIDVNIHPVKTEIKFDNERDIWQILMAAVRDAVGKFSDISTLDFDTAGKPDIPVFNPVDSTVHAPHIDFNPQYNPFTPTVTTKPSSISTIKSGGRTQQHSSAKGWEELFGTPADTPADAVSGQNKTEQSPTLFASRLSWPEEKPVTDNEDIASLYQERSNEHYQLRGAYIITQIKSGLMLIDQNRASQRILFEEYMKRLQNRSAHTQKVLFPEVVQFPPSYSSALPAILEELNSLGFDLTDLGGNSYSIAGTPAGLGGLDTVKLVYDLVTAATDNGISATEQTHRILATELARRAAMPYGEFLSNEDMENMVQQLSACETQKYTADGKTIITVISYGEIEKRFT
ncbi:MAG: DNA mismatch repair protein MutL, partial [Prevotellaceae bacterium]|nr:DNA mismatch repair protein MutL [Prevotellaceae bacterium]